jgi:tetratricopeptide (TPR) repeat protein
MWAAGTRSLAALKTLVARVEQVIEQALLHQRHDDLDLSAATVVAQRCRVERGVVWLDFCETARDLGRLRMMASVVRVLFFALVLLTSGGTMASGQIDEHEEWSRRIRELSKAGRQADAIALAEEYREKASEGYGTEHPRYAIALKVLANILRNTDRMEEAESLLRRALEIDEKNFGPEHPNVADDLRDLGVIERNANRAGEAEVLLRRSLAIEEKNLGPQDPKLIPTLTELALLLSINEQIAEARQVFFRILSIRQSAEAVAGPEDLCNSERQQTIDNAVKRKVEAHRKLVNCRKEYEKTKTFFTLETTDERCKQQKTLADRAESKYRAASAIVCPPAARQ